MAKKVERLAQAEFLVDQDRHGAAVADMSDQVAQPRLAAGKHRPAGA